MTTIATDGRSIAGDGLICSGRNTIVDRAGVKVRRLGDGRIVGTSGDVVDCARFVAWLEAGGDYPKIGDVSALVLGPCGPLYYSGEHPVAISAPAAIGSGSDHAITALDLGRDPKGAIEAAALRDPFTGGEIVDLRFEE